MSKIYSNAVGSNADLIAIAGKYVRTTRFVSIGSGTSGTIALPANSTIVLDDFGGTTDAVVSTITGGRPNFTSATTSAGSVVATTFDSAGNYSFTGSPSAYPVALVYRVRQTLADFDSTESDIIGAPHITDSPMTIGTTPISGGTSGSVLFIGAGSVAQQDNASFFYDDAKDFLGLGASAAPAARLHIAGSISDAAWGSSGLMFRIAASTLTDTSSTGTVTNVVASGIGTPTLAASSVTTYTNAASLYIASEPAAGSNVTMTNAYALWIDSGLARFDGHISIGAGGGTNASNVIRIDTGNVSASFWGTGGGFLLSHVARTVTDTSSSGTVSAANMYSLAIMTMAASSVTTYTSAATLYVGGPPAAGSNVTITNAYGLWVDAGDVRFDANLSVGVGGIPTAKLDLAGSFSASAWTTSGIRVRSRAATYTDTSSSGTVASLAVDGLAAPTVAATSVTTYTNAANLYVAAAPTAGSNVTITSGYAIWVDSGNCRFDDFVKIGSTSAPTAQLDIGGAAISSAAWGAVGIGIKHRGNQITDTDSTGTVAAAHIHSLGTSTVNATNVTTYTNSASLYISAAPVAGSNVTMTNSYAIWVDGGDVRFDGSLAIGSSITAVPAAAFQINATKSGAAWTTLGIRIRVNSQTYTDTSSSGTVATCAIDGYATPTLAASSVTTYTNASTVFIGSAPTAGSNVTITAGWALDVTGPIRSQSNLAIGNNASGLATQANLTITGDVSATAAHSVLGQRTRFQSRTYTDTVSSGTVTNAALDGHSTGTIAASSVTTFTNYSTLYVASGPTAGSNVTITNNYAIWADAGNVRLDGNVMIGCTGTPLAALTVNGGQFINVGTQSGTTYTITLADHIVNMTSSSARTVTLPSAASAFDSTNTCGFCVIVVDGSANAATNNVTVNRAGTDTFITGGTSTTINTNGGAVRIAAISATQWAVIT